MGDVEHGTYHSASLVFHACQPAQSRPAQQVEQYGLDVVVAMVGYADGVATLFLTLVVEERISLLSGGHLNADFVFHGEGPSVEIFYRKRHVKLLAQLADESFVAHGFFTAQVEIAMCHADAVTQHEERAKQGHRIAPATYGYQQLVARAEQMIFPNGFLYLAAQWIHKAKVARERETAKFSRAIALLKKVLRLFVMLDGAFSTQLFYIGLFFKFVDNTFYN